MSHARRLVISAWLGFALAALFFYPLAVALDSDIYYLQWQTRDLVETVAALAALTLLLSVAVYHLWGRSTRGSAVALMAVAALPLASLAAGVARQLPFEDLARDAFVNPAAGVGALGIIAVLLVLGIAMAPQIVLRWFRRLLIVVSPVSLVVVGSLAMSALTPAVAVAVESGRDAVATEHRARCAPVLALLFDELSFTYLYDEHGGIREAFPAIRRVASAATNYLAVAAPGSETLTSLPSFLAARHLRDVRIQDAGIFEVGADGNLTPLNAAGPDSLFGTARRLGFATEMSGYYLAYCELLGGLVDSCRSHSFYNYGAIHDRFSPADPILTTLVLWPRQFPFGLLKNRAFAPFQRGLVEEAMAFARRRIDNVPPVFRFVHFSVPHLPFVFDREGYNPPLDPLRTSPDTLYARQVEYVDRLVGDLMTAMRAAETYDHSTIVLFADHGFRFGGRERDSHRIPFIVKTAGQQTRIDVTPPVGGEVLLKKVLEDACTAGTS